MMTLRLWLVGLASVLALVFGTGAAQAQSVYHTLVILANFQDETNAPYSVSQAQSAVFGSSGLNGFISQQSKGSAVLSGDVIGWYTLPVSSTDCNNQHVFDAADQAATAHGYDLSSYDKIIYGFNSQGGCYLIGRGWPGHAGTWGTSLLNMNVLTHEFGWALGLQNGAFTDCPGCPRDPGNSDSVSGTGLASFGYSASERAWLGWLPALPITASGTYPLGGDQLYRIARPDGVTRLELALWPLTDSGGLDIHYVDPNIYPQCPGCTDDYFQTIRADPPNYALARGNSWYDSAARILVTNSGSSVTVTMNADPPPVDTTAPSVPTLTGTRTGSKGNPSESLNWTASTDNVGVVSYTVYKNGVAALSTTATSAVLSLPKRGTTSFCVTARDAARNESACSNTVSS